MLALRGSRYYYCATAAKALRICRNGWPSAVAGVLIGRAAYNLELPRTFHYQYWRSIND